MRRVLPPEGRVGLSVWQGLQRYPLYEALCEAEARYLNTSIDSLATPFSVGDAELRTLLNTVGFQEVEIAPASLTVRFPSPERFVTLTLFAAAAVLPEFSEMDAEARSALAGTVSREIDTTLRKYIEGDMVSFPTHAHIAVAYV